MVSPKMLVRTIISRNLQRNLSPCSCPPLNNGFPCFQTGVSCGVSGLPGGRLQQHLFAMNDGGARRIALPVVVHGDERDNVDIGKLVLKLDTALATVRLWRTIVTKPLSLFQQLKKRQISTPLVGFASVFSTIRLILLQQVIARQALPGKMHLRFVKPEREQSTFSNRQRTSSWFRMFCAGRSIPPAPVTVATCHPMLVRHANHAQVTDSAAALTAPRPQTYASVATSGRPGSDGWSHRVMRNGFGAANAPRSRTQAEAPNHTIHLHYTGNGQPRNAPIVLQRWASDTHSRLLTRGFAFRSNRALSSAIFAFGDCRKACSSAAFPAILYATSSFGTA